MGRSALRWGDRNRNKGRKDVRGKIWYLTGCGGQEREKSPRGKRCPGEGGWLLTEAETLKGRSCFMGKDNNELVLDKLSLRSHC